MASLRIPFRASDGVELALHRVSSAQFGHHKPVVLLPGMFCDHAFFLQRGRGLAYFLAQERGLDVYVVQRRIKGFFHEIVELDVPAAIAAVVRDSGSAELILGGFAGHSAGAGAVLCASLKHHSAMRENLIGLALLSVPHPETGGALRRAGILTGLALTRTLGRFPAKALRMSNMDEAETIFNPWLLWHWRGRFGSYLDGGGKLNVPVYSAVGEEDILWAPLRGAKRLHDLVENGIVGSRFEAFPGFGHGDVVTSKRAKENLWPSFANWIMEVQGKRN